MWLPCDDGESQHIILIYKKKHVNRFKIKGNLEKKVEEKERKKLTKN